MDHMSDLTFNIKSDITVCLNGSQKSCHWRCMLVVCSKRCAAYQVGGTWCHAENSQPITPFGKPKCICLCHMWWVINMLHWKIEYTQKLQVKCSFEDDSVLWRS